MDEPTPRGLPERTGRHRCIRCMADVAAAEYLRNDFLCDACAGEDEYPLKSTPGSEGPPAKDPSPSE